MGFWDWFKKKEVVEEKEIPTEDYELVHLFESYSVDRSDLELDKIESFAESITHYFDALIKDVSRLDKYSLEELAFVFSKIKILTQNSLELNNLLDQLVEFYHEPIIQILKKVDEKKDVKKHIKKLESGKKEFKDLAGLLNVFVVYDDLLNPEKNTVEAIGKEFEDKKFKKEFLDNLTDIKEALQKYIVVVNLKNSLDLDILDKVRDEVFA